jgi:hypothetical protein
MEVSWTDRVRNEVFHEVKEQRNVIDSKRKRANWIGHILRRYYLLKLIIIGNP